MGEWGSGCVGVGKREEKTERATDSCAVDHGVLPVALSVRRFALASGVERGSEACHDTQYEIRNIPGGEALLFVGMISTSEVLLRSGLKVNSEDERVRGGGTEVGFEEGLVRARSRTLWNPGEGSIRNPGQGGPPEQRIPLDGAFRQGVRESENQWTFGIGRGPECIRRNRLGGLDPCNPFPNRGFEGVPCCGSVQAEQAEDEEGSNGTEQDSHQTRS